jgi:hypothetical protein
VIAAGDVTDFGARRHPYLAASAAHILAERLMRPRRLRRAQAIERQQTAKAQQKLTSISQSRSNPVDADMNPALHLLV